MFWWKRLASLSKVAEMSSKMVSFKASLDKPQPGIVGDTEDWSEMTQDLQVMAIFDISSDQYVLEEIDDLKSSPEVFLEDNAFMSMMDSARGDADIEVGEFTEMPVLESIKVLSLKPGPSGMGYKARVEVFVTQIIRGGPQDLEPAIHG